MRILTFNLDAETFAVDLDQVREVLAWSEITQIACAAPHVRGVIHLRGEVVPVIDVRVRLGLSRTVRTPRTCIIIMEPTEDKGKGLIGGMVDAVDEVVDIPEKELRPAPRIGIRLSPEDLRAIGHMENGRLLMLLNADRVFSYQPPGEEEVEERRPPVASPSKIPPAPPKAAPPVPSVAPAPPAAKAASVPLPTPEVPSGVTAAPTAASPEPEPPVEAAPFSPDEAVIAQESGQENLPVESQEGSEVSSDEAESSAMDGQQSDFPATDPEPDGENVGEQPTEGETGMYQRAEDLEAALTCLADVLEEELEDGEAANEDIAPASVETPDLSANDAHEEAFEAANQEEDASIPQQDIPMVSAEEEAFESSSAAIPVEEKEEPAASGESKRRTFVFGFSGRSWGEEIPGNEPLAFPVFPAAPVKTASPESGFPEDSLESLPDLPANMSADSEEVSFAEEGGGFVGETDGALPPLPPAEESWGEVVENPEGLDLLSCAGLNPPADENLLSPATGSAPRESRDPFQDAREQLVEDDLLIDVSGMPPAYSREEERAEEAARAVISPLDLSWMQSPAQPGRVMVSFFFGSGDKAWGAREIVGGDPGAHRKPVVAEKPVSPVVVPPPAPPPVAASVAEESIQVACPGCGKKFRLQASLLPAKGRKLRCSACALVFFQTLPTC
ncbi:MAG: zinc-ribbon domain-containing protein [Magnetococcales bacterium]|nr:zinc-ribbon domain-containing protein [Magnetococcales bacterium]